MSRCLLIPELETKMKKSLMALAVMGAFAGTAMAANVTVYGVIDTGLQYQHVDTDGVANESTFEMSSGVMSGSRVGLKGSEDLGNGLTVGFVLENGFSSDDGKMGQGDRLFGREAQVNLSGSFGTIAMGRMGNLVSGNGTFGLAGGLSPFGTTWGEYAATPNNVMTTFDRYDNMVTYKSPTFSGFTAYAQYSFGTDNNNDFDGTEGKSSVDRYAAIGATYINGPLSLVAIVDQTNYSEKRWSADASVDTNTDVDDAISFTLGGSYDFGVTKLYASGQYFKDAMVDSVDRISSSMFDLDKNGSLFQMKGFGLTLGADVPLAGGTFKVGTAYMDGTIETVNKWNMSDTLIGEVDLTRWNTTVGYNYPFSKRTSVYGVASYSHNNVDVQSLDIDSNVIEAAVGLVHKF